MAVSQPDRLKSEIDEHVPDLVAVRRDLHEHPETAFEEVRTSALVAQRLRAMGLDVQTNIAKTGVVGLLRGEAASTNAKTLAIRADMDALPVVEQCEHDYRSQIDGKMHACGHDGHTSILLTVADILHRHKAELRGNVKFIFQPAEEMVGGALPMVESGIMQDVDGVIGLHLMSTLPVGQISVSPGTVFASADRVRLLVHGKGGHGGMPDGAIDPIVIAAQIIVALQTLVSRQTSPFVPAVLSIGEIHAGTAPNIIPEQVYMHGSLRSYSSEQREFLIRRIHELAQGIAQAMGGTCSVEVYNGCPACVNDVQMTELVHAAAAATVGEVAIHSDFLTTASDDMAYFLQSVPGCYFIVGASNADKGANFPHHHPRFNIDEDALPIAVEALIRSTYAFLDSEQSLS